MQPGGQREPMRVTRFRRLRLPPSRPQLRARVEMFDSRDYRPIRFREKRSWHCLRESVATHMWLHFGCVCADAPFKDEICANLIARIDSADDLAAE